MMNHIQLLVLDVDGTLTDGTISYGEYMEMKSFNVKDGLILKVLPSLGIQTVFLTGRASSAVERRARELGAMAMQGVDDKLAALCELLSGRKLEPENCAYIGDDLNDYAAMSICGYKSCPSDAVAAICAICDYVSPYKAAHGAVRDICEHILKQEGTYGDFLRLFGVNTRP
ncbi:MAG: HAD hydrolase family protein [Clostridium sp.]|jgi:3-deoxy-D-manno-octulosonate 8-phosphate phosphatase (KDO 8-P phosphatase)|nr:HAD hydrolase family protein [Clostridium sp.]